MLSRFALFSYGIRRTEASFGIRKNPRGSGSLFSSGSIVISMLIYIYKIYVQYIYIERIYHIETVRELNPWALQFALSIVPAYFTLRPVSYINVLPATSLKLIVPVHIPIPERAPVPREYSSQILVQCRRWRHVKLYIGPGVHAVVSALPPPPPPHRQTNHYRH